MKVDFFSILKRGPHKGEPLFAVYDDDDSNLMTLEEFVQFNRSRKA